MIWIGIPTGAEVMRSDVKVTGKIDPHNRACTQFQLKFNRETCDHLCPNSRRLILGIDDDRLYFKEVNGTQGYKYKVSFSDGLGIAMISNKNDELARWATQGRKARAFDCELKKDEKIGLYYVERPKEEGEYERGGESE